MSIVNTTGKLFLDHHQVREIFHISRPSLYRLTGRQLIEAVKSGRRTLWSVESILAYLNSQPKAEIGKSRKSPAPRAGADQAVSAAM